MKCSFCGREVHETIHQKSDYVVDYYFSFTGDLIESETDGAGATKFFRLTNPREMAICVDCFAAPDKKEQWKEF